MALSSGRRCVAFLVGCTKLRRLGQGPSCRHERKAGTVPMKRGVGRGVLLFDIIQVGGAILGALLGAFS